MLTKRTPKGGQAAPGATAFSKAGSCHGPRQPENLPKRLPARSARSIRPSAGTPSPEQASFKTCLLVVKRAVRGLGAGSASITASALSKQFLATPPPPRAGPKEPTPLWNQTCRFCRSAVRSRCNKPQLVSRRNKPQTCKGSGSRLPRYQPYLLPATYPNMEV